MREEGFSKEKSAQGAKELTVNFNTHGQVGPLMNSLWLFSNAGVQGTYRMFFRALKYRRVQQLAAGMAVMAFLSARYNRWEDEDEWDQFSAYNKDNHWLWLSAWKKAFSFKLPYGYNMFAVAGTLAEEAMYGNLTAGQATKRMLSAANDAFNPLGGGSPLQFLSPTGLDPIAQLLENKNFFGGPIMKEQPEFGPEKPAHTMHFRGVSGWAKAVTSWLNKITGGTEDVSGAVDINPEVLDHAIEFVGGGLGKFIANTVNLGATVFKEGELPEVNRIPIVRQVLKESSEWVDTGFIYEMLNKSGANVLNERELDRLNDAIERASEVGTISPSQKERYMKDIERNQAAVQASLKGFPSRTNLLEQYEAYLTTPVKDRDTKDIKEINRLIAQHNRRAVKTGEQKITKQARDYRADRAYEKLHGRKRPKGATGGPKAPRAPRPTAAPKRTPLR